MYLHPDKTASRQQIFSHSSLRMPTPADLTPLKNSASKSVASSGWMTARKSRHPMSSLSSNTAPTDELIVARLNGIKQGREQYEQGLEDLQNRQEEIVQRSRSNDEILQGKLMAVESQMVELRGEVERLRNGSHVSQRSDSSEYLQSPKHEDDQSLRGELHTPQALMDLEEYFQ